MKLKDKVLKEIKKNNSLRRDLMSVHNKSEYTILKWLRENSPELIKLSSLDVIAAHLRQDIDEMVIREECDFKIVV